MPFRDMPGVSTGTLANRPSADGTKGLYFASNVLGGQLYYDITGTWTPVSASEAVIDTAEVIFNGTSQAAATEVLLTTYATIGANAWTLGRSLEISDMLAITTPSDATVRNLRLRLRIGGLAGTLLADTGNFAVKVSTAITDLPLSLQAVIAYRSGAPAAAILVAGGVISPFRGWNANPDSADPWNNAFVTPAVNLAAAQALVLTVSESVNTVADLIKHEHSSVRLL